MSGVIYSRAQHAAHYSYRHPAEGHDLESWDVALPLYSSPRPDSVPPNATRHHGYVDRDGCQRVVFIRHAPLTGTCSRCESGKVAS